MTSLTSKTLIYLAFSILKTLIHLDNEAQITFLNFAELAMVLLKYSGISNHVIDLEKEKQLLYRAFYNLGLVKLKTLKTYIQTNLIHNFICFLPVSAPIFFMRKPNKSICLCTNDQGLNNLIVKTWYLLLLIERSWNWLNQAKQFPQLVLTNVYYRTKTKKGNK